MLTIAEKLIKTHLVKGKMDPGEEITIKLDQCLLQDATGTAAWLEFQAIGVKKVKPEFCIQYIDHNLLQVDYKNMDDHLFLMTVASKYGAHLSLQGNGISHHVHKERFTKPGQTMVGCDSHTSTSGGSGMLAIGVGGLDVAVGMATGNFTFTMPEIVGVKLTGKLRPFCTAKDVILEILSRINVDGGKGKILEFFGNGVKTLSVAERSTIANMGAETGATTTVFPSDANTKKFFKAEQRLKDYKELKPDKGAKYADIIEIDLGKTEPLIAAPFSPGNVKHVRELAGLEIGQAMVGSSTNSSYAEIMNCSKMLEKKGRNPETDYHFLPGSRQLLATIERDGGLKSLIKNGARITEPACNACIGIGNAPGSDVISIRSFPRNWEGRSGTAHDHVYLSSTETATAAAIKGELIDPRDLKIKFPNYKAASSYVINDSMIIKPRFKNFLKKGPNIKPLPSMPTTMPDSLKGQVILKVGDDISTDHILQGGEKVMSLRSNIPAISEYVFYNVDSDFVERCRQNKGGFIIGGSNYGQGSSREHAAIAPKFLGIKAVIAMDFARIHRSNLINFGILPIEFENKKEYSKIKQGNKLEITNIKKILENADPSKISVKNKTNNKTINCKLELKEREKQILGKGSLLNYIKQIIKG